MTVEGSAVTLHEVKTNKIQSNQDKDSILQKLFAEYREGTFLKAPDSSNSLVAESTLDESDALYATILDYTAILKKKMDDIEEKERIMELKRLEFLEQVSRSQTEHRKELV